MREVQIIDDDALNKVLMAMNESGETPVVIGFDGNEFPFLAYGCAPSGDDWWTGVVFDDTHSSEFDYNDGTTRCQECGAFDRRPTERLKFPLSLIQKES